MCTVCGHVDECLPAITRCGWSVSYGSRGFFYFTFNMKERNMNLNWKLKATIYEKGWTQKAFSEAIDISELELSRLITGRKIPNANIRRKIADMLMKPEVDLFDAELYQSVEEVNDLKESLSGIE